MNIQVVCQNCGSSLEIPYVRLGTSSRCEHCLQYTVPNIPAGAQMPETGNALSYSDFRGLTEYAPYRIKIEQLVAMSASWASCDTKKIRTFKEWSIR